MYKTTAYAILLISIFVMTGCDRSEELLTAYPDAEIARRSEQLPVSNSGFQIPLSWADLSDEALWEHIAQSDSLADVGLKAPGASEGMRQGRVLVTPAQQAAAKSEIVKALHTQIRLEDNTIPLVRVKLRDEKQLKVLRKLPFIDYVEPAYIIVEEGVWQDDPFPGCGVDDFNGSLGTLPEGDKISENLLYKVDVADAWNRSNGQGITIAVIGTGVSQYQAQLNEEFTAGASWGRTFNRDYTWADPDVNPKWHDNCGHESKLIANMAAPLDGKGTAGIAYRVNVHSIRIDNEVWNQVDSQHLRDAIDKAKLTSQIINLALGSFSAFEGIRNKIEDVYYDPTLSVLFIGAAGTSTSTTNQTIVMFPARMSEVVAVTGIDPDGTPCSNCHYGSKVELVAHTNEPTLNPYRFGVNYSQSEIVNSGGSSTATGTISGVAALVWSRYPSENRDQILSRLKGSTDLARWGLSKDNATGWGVPNAACGVGGLCEVNVTGPTVVTESGNYTFTAEQVGSSVPVSYQWSTGETTPSITVYLEPQYDVEQYLLYEVEVTDLTGGYTRSDAKAVIVRASNSDPNCPPEAISCG